jgi:hypothetical protein
MTTGNNKVFLVVVVCHGCGEQWKIEKHFDHYIVDIHIPAHHCAGAPSSLWERLWSDEVEAASSAALDLAGIDVSDNRFEEGDR